MRQVSRRGQESVRRLLRRPRAPRDLFIASERARLREHFARALRVVGGRDASYLPPALQEARARNLDRLRLYRARGVFPRNSDFAGRMPYFVDQGGRACAVAHLVLADGRPEVADAVVRLENNAYIPEMTSPELCEWAAKSGFTLEELAIIQPDYCSHYACQINTGGPDPSNPGATCTYAPVDCDDGNACTIDTCAEPYGCQTVPLNCTDDGDECTTDVCDPERGCIHEFICGEGADGGCAIAASPPAPAAPLLLMLLAAQALRRRRHRGRRPHSNRGGS